MPTPLSSSEIPAAMALRDAYRLTLGEARVILLMSQGGIIPASRVRDVYCDNPEADAMEARQSIKRIRAKNTGLVINSHYGLGYELAADSLLAVRSIIKEGRMMYEMAQ